MSKEQKRNIIIVLIALVLVIGGIFYVKKDSKNKIKGIETLLIDENDVDVNIEGEKVLENEENKEENNIMAETPKISQEKERFNLAMDNARKSFREREYDKSIGYYNEALNYDKLDVVYSGMYVTHGAQNEWEKALMALNKAIELNPSYTDYWAWKLALLDERTITPFQDLKSVYNEGLLKVDSKTKVNLVTYFAGIAERNNEKQEALALWEYAKEIFPQNSSIFQEEINRLKTE